LPSPTEATEPSGVKITTKAATNPNLDHTATHICPPKRLYGPANTLVYPPTTLAAPDQSLVYPERFRPGQRPAADRDVILAWPRSSHVYPRLSLYGLGATPFDGPTEP
jgi:hypothetical protein